ncbi:MAG: RDD family protein [bacterium]|nr:RDD family protein [bacterium]
MENVKNEAFDSQLQVQNMEKDSYPWRRFFARGLDIYIYTVLWGSFISLILNINWLNRSPGGELFDVIICVVLMLVLEPLLLHFFGTTIGKWMLGLRVTDHNGKRLSYHEAFVRTRTMFVRGMGLDIPIYHLVRLWKSYKECKDCNVLDWEVESEVVLHSKKIWHIIGYIGLSVVLFGFSILAGFLAEMPKYRGEISVAEFSQNYNQIADYLGWNEESSLDEFGKRKEKDSVVPIIDLSVSKPEFLFTEENGVMQGMQFSQTIKDSDLYMPSYQEDMILCIKAFVQAQKSCNLFTNELNPIINNIVEDQLEEFQVTVYGVTITYKVEYSGYIKDEDDGMLYRDDGTEHWYSVSFAMNKTEE